MALRAQRLFPWALGIVGLQAAFAIDPNLVRSMPGAHFDKADWQLLRQTVSDVVEDPDDKLTRKWKNDSSGHSGSVTSLGSRPSSGGRPCRLVRIDNAAAGRTSSMRYTLCKDADGVWRDADSGADFTNKPVTAPKSQ